MSTKSKVEEALKILSSLVSSGDDQLDQPEDHPTTSSLPSSACRVALSNLREIRSVFAGSDRKGAKLKRLNSTTDTGAGCSSLLFHKFVCLAKKNTEKVPTATEKPLLCRAGLGEKVVKFTSYDMQYKDIVDVLTIEYPKIADCGGVEFLRYLPNSRDLIAIDLSQSAGSFLLTTILAIVGQGRVYIRPIQKDLPMAAAAATSMTVANDAEGLMQPKERCLKCSEEFPLSSLRIHASSCQVTPVAAMAKTVPISNDLGPPWEYDFDNDFHTFPDVDLGLEPAQRSLRFEVEETLSKKKKRSHEELLQMLSEEVVPGRDVCMEVRRDFILTDAIRAAKRTSFNPLKRLKVEFVGESAEDCGGPSREFWMLLTMAFQGKMCEGPPGNAILIHDAVAMQNNNFFAMGQLIAAGIVQSRAKFPIFSAIVYAYLTGQPVSSLSPCIDSTSIPNQGVVSFLRKVQALSDVDGLREVLLEQIDILAEAGYRSPIGEVSLGDTKSICNVVSLHYGLLSVKAELDQMRSGLMHNSGQLMKFIEESPDEFEPFFHAVGGQPDLTADLISSLFKTKEFSDKGCNSRVREEETYIWFKDYLATVEDAQDLPVQLQDVLIFVSGCKEVPAGQAMFSLSFANQMFPTASTCSSHLVLPLVDSYDVFCERCHVSFVNNTGFGLV